MCNMIDDNVAYSPPSDTLGARPAGWYFMTADARLDGPYGSRHDAAIAERRYLETYRSGTPNRIGRADER